MRQHAITNYRYCLNGQNYLRSRAKRFAAERNHSQVTEYTRKRIINNRVWIITQYNRVPAVTTRTSKTELKYSAVDALSRT